jgi:DNA-binding transcriptional MerR regulator
MLRIGDFSQLAQVSVPTLRHYDELGLLKPAHVDKFTDYRYYDMAQLPRLNRILALKDLGLSLDQIKKLLEEDVPASQLRGMLAMKRADIELQIYQEQARLARVEARLRQIENEAQPSIYDVVLKKVDAQPIAGVMQVVPHVSQMNEYRVRALTRLYDGLRATGLDEARDELMLYHNPEYSDDNVNMEAAVTLSQRDLKRIEITRVPDQLRVWELPGVATLATTIHHGVLWEIPNAIIALFAWIGQNGYHSAGPIRELHLFGREVDIPDTHEAYEIPRVVDIQVPVTRAEV